MIKKRLNRRLSRLFPITFLLLSVFLSTCRCHRDVSFYGNSFIRVPVNKASTTTEVELNFFTSQSDGLLLLAAGTTDYLRLELRSGTIQCRLDVGSGPVLISSPPGLTFSNLRWHRLVLKHSKNSVQLKVDGMYESQVVIPGKFTELNVDRFIFVGGTTTSDDDDGDDDDDDDVFYFGNVVQYRGCMNNVSFNSIDLVQLVQKRQEPSADDNDDDDDDDDGNDIDNVVARAITWGCSKEFGSVSSLPITFTNGSSSYVAFPSLGTREEAAFLFSLRTRSSDAVLVYSSGSNPRSDYLSLRLIAGSMALYVNKGSGSFSLTSPVRVNDGVWHQIELNLDRISARLAVDGRRIENETHFSETRFLDLTTYVFVGGVDGRTRREISNRNPPPKSGSSSSSSSSRWKAAASLVGCISNFRMDGKLFGFQEATSTRDLLPDCQWRYDPCSSNPCPPLSACVETGFFSFTCSESKTSSSSSSSSAAAAATEAPFRIVNRQNFTSSSAPQINSAEMISVLPVQVREGERITLTDDVIRMNKDHKSANIVDIDDVLFTIVKAPAHGSIAVDGGARSHGNGMTFTRRDLKNMKVHYDHDGSETTADYVEAEVEFRVRQAIEDDPFPVKHAFTLRIKVLPVNDRPEIHLPEAENLVLVANTQLRVTPLILNAVDDDDKPSGVEYAIYQQPAADTGYFEILKTNGVRARTSKFTQDDVNKGRVEYIHRGTFNQRVRIQASDGKDSSEVRVLRITAVPLLLNPVVNTGSVVARGRCVPIARSNLTFTTNAGNQEMEIRYVVTDPPYEGEIQKQEYSSPPMINNYNLNHRHNHDNQDYNHNHRPNDGENYNPDHCNSNHHNQDYNHDQWVVVSTFTQKHIDENRICYCHYNDSDSRGDYFRFRVNAMSHETHDYEYHVTVVDIDVRLVRNRPLVLRGTRELAITWDELKTVSSLPYHGPHDVGYELITTPTNGSLYKMYGSNNNDGGGKKRKKRLNTGSHVTQSEINEARIVYRLNRVLHSPMEDAFDFEVSVPGAPLPVRRTFAIRYEPIEGRIRFTNNGLTDVDEGGIGVITSQDLFAEMNGFRDFQYVITDRSRHGSIRIVEPKTKVLVTGNATAFTNDDIANRRVEYVHDDTETEEDSFGFTVTSLLFNVPTKARSPNYHQRGEIFEQSEIFEIEILLKNDNPPRRIVDKVFHVVTSRGRTITDDDLFYEDPDVDFNSFRLEYTWQVLVNGLIVLASNHSVVMYRFTQRDISDGILYLQHSGPAYGKSVIWVTDGKHVSTNLLEIRASDPFVRMTGDGGGGEKVARVERGKSVRLARENVGVVTNVDVAKENVTFHVTEGPRHGRLTLKGQSPVSRFSLFDLEHEDLRYVHDNDDEDPGMDSLRFRVSAVTCHVEGSLQIEVIPAEESERALETIQNRGAIIEESDIFVFTSRHLNITRAGRLATDVRYRVVKQPRFGRLYLKDGYRENDGRRGNAEDDDEDEEFILTTFSQNEINSEVLMYAHNDDDDDDKDGRGGIEYEDDVIFDVTDGTVSLFNVSFHISIVPSSIPLEVADIVVKEGDRVYLSKDRIMVPNRYYQSQDIDFVLVKSPAFGQIEYQATPGQRRMHFTYAQVRAWAVVYAHDGSDSVEDKFSVVARLRDGASVVGGGQSDPRTIRVNILPSNDQWPRLTINRPLQVWMGSRSVVTSDLLMVEDSDSSADDIKFIVTTPSNNGYIALFERPLVPIFNFTQLQINEEKILFVHTGAEECEIHFDITDGLNVIKDQIFQIIAQHMTITLTKDLDLRAFPGVIQPIGKVHLRAVTDNPDHLSPVTFTVVRGPSKGKLLRMADPSKYLAQEIESFTQDDVDEMTVFYNYTSAMTNWTELDTFQFTLTTDHAVSLEEEWASVIVAFDQINDDNRHLLISADLPVTLKEGGQVQLSKGHLDSTKLKRLLSDCGLRNVEIFYILTEIPKHGVLEIRGKNGTADDQFIQRDVNKGYVTYIHDHSETQSDHFRFRLEVDVTAPAGYEPANKERLVPRFQCDVNVTIVPVNDQMFHLLTRNPSMELIQGSSFDITRRELLTVDADSRPAEIRYEITMPPDNGVIVNTRYENRTITSATSSFTQEDIDKNHIRFIQDGSTRSGVFSFQVTDGGFLPLGKSFHIYVHPLRLETGNGSDVILKQGEITVVLSPSHIPIRTNGVRKLVRYNVTRNPAHGNLYLADSAVTSFGQRELDNAEIMYIQSDMRHSTDSFDVVVFDSYNVLPSRRVTISVKARLRKTDLYFSGGGQDRRQMKVTVDHLDASDLALTTGSNPTFYVLNEPVYGFLVLNDTTRRQRREAAKESKPEEELTGSERARTRTRSLKSSYREPSYMREAVFVFTHDDVINERLEYRLLPIDAMTSARKQDSMTSARKQDSMTYVLHARNAQPATDVFRVIINPATFGRDPASSAGNSTSDGSKDGEGEGGEGGEGEEDGSTGDVATVSSSGVNRLHLLVVLLVSGLTLLIIVAVVATRCYLIYKKRKRYKMAAAVARDKGTFTSMSEGVVGCRHPSTTTPQAPPSPPPLAPPSGPSHLSRSNDNHSSAFVAPGRGNLKDRRRRREKGREGAAGSGRSREGVLFAEPVRSEWDNVDPEIVQHCRKTNPLLRSEKLWV